MTNKNKAHLSNDHRIQREAVNRMQSESTDDFSPRLPKEEFDLRISKAKELLVNHRMDAMVLFAEENKYYYSGCRDTVLMFTNRYRYCIIISQEHEPVLVGDFFLISQIMESTWIRDVRSWSGIKSYQRPNRFVDAFIDTIISLALGNKFIGMEYGPHHILQFNIDEIREIERSLPNAIFVSADKLLWEQKMI
ncbi:MAG: aminopeptidase P family N-terminal domain-containing protein [Pseudomonadota bacterium]